MTGVFPRSHLVVTPPKRLPHTHRRVVRDPGTVPESDGEGTTVKRWTWRAGIAAVLIAWLVLGSLGGPTVGKLSEVQENDNANFLPKQAESTLVANEAAAHGGVAIR